jgi:hypothetical protein
MTNNQPWSPPDWARLIAYLAGIAFFVVQPTMFGPPHFGLLAIDAIVLIGISEAALKQLITLIAVLFGRSPPQDQPPRSSETQQSERPPPKESFQEGS